MTMQKDCAAILETLSGKTAMVYQPLEGSGFAIRPDLLLESASIIKLFIMADAFRRAEEGGFALTDRVCVTPQDQVGGCGSLKLLSESFSLPIIDLIRLMIVLSDNTATNVLIDVLGFDSINQTISDLGYGPCLLRRKMFDYQADLEGRTNVITAGAVARFLRDLAQGRVVSQAASDRMVTIMKDQLDQSQIRFFWSQRRPEVAIANKTGLNHGVTHDCGIVYSDKPFVLCLLSNEVDVPASMRAFQDIAWSFFE